MDDPPFFPEERVFRDILSIWSKGRITYNVWFDEPMDAAYVLANTVLEQAERAEQQLKELKSNRHS